MKLRTSPIQIQKTILAPIMQQSIEVLLLPIMELNTAITQEIENNPLLEIDEEASKTELLQKMESELQSRIENIQQETDFNYQGTTPDDEINTEKPFVKNETLEDHLLWHLKADTSNPLELKIGEFIIGNMDEDGFLKITFEEIIENFKILDKSILYKTLNLIRNFGPAGICCFDLRECLLIQLQRKNIKETSLSYRIISDYLTELGRKKYLEIAKKLKIPLNHVKTAAQFIGTLDPRPARNFRPIESNIYIQPDVTITENQDYDYQITIRNERIPKLRINPLYKTMLNQKNLKAQDKEFIEEKLKNAISFIKSIDQRSKTIKGISQYIIEKQKNFFKLGHSALTPMTLKDVALAVSRNESTISRAINNKYMDTPQGVFAMKFFFSSSIGNDQKKSISNRSVKMEIKELIEDENKLKPLSDQKIVKYFEKKDMKIARRTISKYRQALNILPSHLRKK